MSAYFRGIRYILPQAKAAVDVSRVVRATIAPANVGCIIGQADDGEPLKAFLASSIEEVKDRFKSGVLVDLAHRFFFPSPRQAGGSLLWCVRPEAATQATGDATGAGDVELFTLTAKSYGLNGNTIEVKSVDSVNNAAPDARDIYIRNNALKISQAILNVGGVITVHYIGTADTPVTTAVLDITNNTLSTTITADPGGHSVSIDLTLPAYATPEGVVKYFNTHPSGAYKAWIWPVSHPATRRRATTYLKDVTSLDIKVAGASVAVRRAVRPEGTKTLCMTPWEYIDAINAVSVLVDADRGSYTSVLPWTIQSSYTMLPAMENGVAGEAPAPITTDWGDALEIMENEVAQLMICGSTDIGEWLQFQEHCMLMGDRIGFVGAEYGTPLEGAQEWAAFLNADRMVVSWPGIVTYNESGEIINASPMEVAAMHAGILAGQPPDEPSTHKFIQALGLEVDMTKAVRIQCQNSGISCLSKVPSLEPGQQSAGFWFSKGVTAVQQNSRLWNSDGTTPEISLRRLADLLVKTVEYNSEIDLVGRSARWAKGIARAYFTTLLNEFRDEGFLQVGIDQNTKERYDAWRNLVIEQYEDILRVSAEVNFTTPINYVFFTAYVLPPRDIL